MNKRLRQAFKVNKESFKPKRPIIRAILGNGKGIVKTDRANYVYARTTDGNIVQVLNKKVANIDGLAVFLGFTEEEPFIMQVLGEFNAYTIVADTQLPNHAHSHEWPYTDTIYVQPEQFTPWLIVPYSGTSVQLYGGIAYTHSGTVYTASQEIDLQSYVPTSGSLYVLIGLNSLGNPIIQPGTLRASPNQLVPNDIPIPNPSVFPLSAIRLRAGQTTIQKSPSVRDIVDLRWAGYSVLSDTKEVYILQNGVLIVSATEIDFTGSGVSVSSSGSRAAVVITDTGGGEAEGSNYGLHPGIVTGTLNVPTDWRMLLLGPMTMADGSAIILNSGSIARTL